VRSDDQALSRLDAALKALAQRVRTNKELQETPLANDNGPRYVSGR